MAVACSSEVHPLIDQSARVMDVDVLEVPVGDDGRLTGDGLRTALVSDGAGVFAVVATAGTTNVGIIDDLASIAEVAEEFGLWLHVDGAYGLAALAVPEMRGQFAGLERADSFITDPHKWLFAPFDACALIYRDPEKDAVRTPSRPATWMPPWRPRTSTPATTESTCPGGRAVYRSGFRWPPTAPTPTQRPSARASAPAQQAVAGTFAEIRWNWSGRRRCRSCYFGVQAGIGHGTSSGRRNC